MDKDSVEGCFSGLLTAGEDHSGDPEENDVIAGNQNIRGIEIIQILGFVGPAKGLKGPQCGGEPGIQHILFPDDILTTAVSALCGILSGDGIFAALRAAPCRDLMTPPELTGDTPVVNIFHPVGVGLGKTVGNEFGFAILHNTQSFLGKRLHLYKPLCGNNGFHIVVAAVAGTNIVLVLFHLFQKAQFLQVGNDGFAGLVAIHSLILAAQLVDNALIIQNPNGLQIVPQTYLKVIGVVSRSHLYTAGAEFHVHILVSNNGNFPVHQRQQALLADDVLITFVIGVHGNAGVTQHGLGTGGGNDDIAAFLTHDGILQVPEIAGLILIFHLCVRQCGDAVGAPVYDAAALIDIALFIKAHKYLTDGFGTAFVHGEAVTVPVTGGTKHLLLTDDASAVLFFPVPDPIQKLFTAKVVAGQSLLAELLFHLDLRCNAGMVIAGKPQGAVALHTLETNENVLQGAVHGVTHVKLTGDVWRRHHNGKGLFILVLFRMEIAAPGPHVVNTGFHLLGVINLWKFFHEYHLL